MNKSDRTRAARVLGATYVYLEVPESLKAWVESNRIDDISEAVPGKLAYYDLATLFCAHREDAVRDVQKLAAKQADIIIRMHAALNEVRNINTLFDAHTERVANTLKLLGDALAEEE